MFLPPSDLIDNQKLLDSYQLIKKDYINFKDKNYFFDYSHDYELTVKYKSFSDFTLPKSTGHFWQVCPLIYNRQIVPIMPLDVQNSFTAKIINSFPILPVLTVFSILEPNSDIVPHIDNDEHIVGLSYHHPVVKYHLSLDIPESGECALIVGDEKRILKNGDLNPFDEKITHYAYNHSSHRRGALIISYLREDLY